MYDGAAVRRYNNTNRSPHYCPSTAKILDRWYGEYLADVLNTKENFFLSNQSLLEKENLVLNMLMDIFRYLIWEYKPQGKIPVYHSMMNDLQYNVMIIRGASRRIDNYFANSNFFSAYGNGRHGRGGGP
jgi:hypothetical protein